VIKLNLEKQTMDKLQRLIGGFSCDFLGFTVNLETSIITDKLSYNSMQGTNERNIQTFATLLCHYALANPTPLSGTLVKFRDLPGGCAYEGAFVERVVEPVAEVFGENPQELIKAAKLLNGIQLKLGDASVEITALRGIPLTYILWGSNEFPASSTILYDESASKYLPTEDLAVLGELTTSRLKEAKNNSCPA
jgi:hypothetical protein